MSSCGWASNTLLCFAEDIYQIQTLGDGLYIAFLRKMVALAYPECAPLDVVSGHPWRSVLQVQSAWLKFLSSFVSDRELPSPLV